MMHIQFKRQITINAPAQKAWSVLAHDYDNISKWIAVIPESEALYDIPAPEGTNMGGRICTAQGIGQVKEAFTYYDEQAMRFGYKAIEGLPGFMKHAENNWSVHAQGPNQCVVETQGKVELSRFLGLFLAPFVRWNINRGGTQALEELQHYIEHDQPHPRKVKAQAKYLKKAPAF